MIRPPTFATRTSSQEPLVWVRHVFQSLEAHGESNVSVSYGIAWMSATTTSQ